MWWQQIIYSMAGLVLGVTIGRLWSSVRERRNGKSKKVKGEQNGGLPLPLTILIAVLVVGSIGGQVKAQIDTHNQSKTNHTLATKAQDTADQAKAIAAGAKAQAARIRADEKLLRQLIVGVSTAKTPKQVQKVIHRFIVESRKLDQQPIGTDQPGPPRQISGGQQQPSGQSHPQPQPSHHPSSHPTHHPSKPPPSHHPTSKPKPVTTLIPNPVCTKVAITINGKPICGHATNSAFTQPALITPPFVLVAASYFSGLWYLFHQGRL